MSIFGFDASLFDVYSTKIFQDYFEGVDIEIFVVYDEDFEFWNVGFSMYRSLLDLEDWLFFVI